MKKSYLMMAAAATMFAACTQADFVNDIPASAPKAIDFKSPFIGKSTRAENSSSNYTLKFSDHHNSFAVWGYKSTADEPVFNGKTVNVTLGTEANSEIYNYEGLVYWDEGATFYQFYAAAPAEHDWDFAEPLDGNKKEGAFTTSIELDKTRINQGKGGHLESLKPEPITGVSGELETVANQDLLIAAPCEPRIGETVGFDFIHILSRLNIVVSKRQGLNQEVRTFEVSVHNMKLKGHFNEAADLGSDILANGTTKRWTTEDEKTYYKATASEGAIVQSGAERYVIQTLVVPQSASFESVAINGSNISDAEAPYLYVKYGIQNGTDGAGKPTFEKFEKYYNLAQIFGVTGVPGNESLAFNEGWENTLTLTIGPASIDFKANVATWATGTKKENSLGNGQTQNTNQGE